MFIQKYKKVIIIALSALALIALILSFFFNKEASLSVTDSTPVTSSSSVELFSPVKITFSSNVVVADIKINSSPEETWSIENITPTSIEAKHKLAYEPYTKYNLEILHKNKVVGNIEFTTQKSQGDPRLTQTIEEEMKIEYPLSRKTPYNTDLYYVVYSAPMTLEITIKDPLITPEKAFNEIRAWVTSVGGDVDAHKYIISETPYDPSLHIESDSSREMPPDAKPSGRPSPTPFDWDSLQDDGT